MNRINQIGIITLLLCGQLASTASAVDAGTHAGSNRVESNPIVSLSDNDAFVQINRSDHRYFQLSNGKTFIPVGPNICFPRFETEEAKVFALYDRQFRTLHENGGNYSRIYLSAPFWEVEHEKAGEFDLQFAGRLDRLLGLAKQYQIKLKFCFEYFRTVEKVPAPFKYANPFCKPIYSVKYGGTVSSMPEFLNSEKGRDLYLNRLKFFAGRYGTNSQIFAWELWNEMNSIESATGTDLLQWNVRMFEEAHRLFPSNLIVQDLGSFDTLAVRKIYQQYTSLAGNDYAQVHRYLDPGAHLEVCRGPIDVLTSDAILELQKYVSDKPVVLGETGAVESRHSGPFKLYPFDKEGILLHDILFAPFFSGSAGPGQCWHWSYYIDLNQLWWHYGRFTEAIKDYDPVKEKAEPIRLDQQHFRVYALKGQHTILIWLRDVNSNWKTELVDKIDAPVNREITFDSWPLKVTDNTKATVYDPWKNQWTESKMVAGTLRLPDFRRSIVIRLNQ